MLSLQAKILSLQAKITNTFTSVLVSPPQLAALRPCAPNTASRARRRRAAPGHGDARVEHAHMHWLLHLLVDAVLIAGLAAAYKAYQEHRRKQSEYARVQLYEDADKPCVPAPFSPASARGSNTCSTPLSRPLTSAWQHHLTSRARCQPRTPSACRPPPQFAAAHRSEAGPTRTTETTTS